MATFPTNSSTPKNTCDPPKRPPHGTPAQPHISSAPAASLSYRDAAMTNTLSPSIPPRQNNQTGGKSRVSISVTLEKVLLPRSYPIGYNSGRNAIEGQRAPLFLTIRLGYEPKTTGIQRQHANALLHTTSERNVVGADRPYRGFRHAFPSWLTLKLAD